MGLNIVTLAPMWVSIRPDFLHEMRQDQMQANDLPTVWRFFSFQNGGRGRDAR
jgi:hypothetical protein